MEILKPIVEQCILNQARGYWFLFNAMIVTISICMKLNIDFNHRIVQVFPLCMAQLMMNWKLCMDRDNGCVSLFLSFLETFIIACAHNMHVGLGVGPKVQKAKMCH